jgi:hypothetical protein
VAQAFLFVRFFYQSIMDIAAFESVAKQMMTADSVELAGAKIPVRRTSAQRLRTVTFTVDGDAYTAVEQNPDKPSRWGKLAKEGKQVVQFKDDASNRFVAVAVDGKVKPY